MASRLEVVWPMPPSNLLQTSINLVSAIAECRPVENLDARIEMSRGEILGKRQRRLPHV
jgi:hypothetical protein